MTREEKTAAIEVLREELANTPFFYFADASTLTVAKINQLRRKCFEQGIKMKVAKNTLIPDSYTNLTLPTNRAAYIPVVSVEPK